jgi:drug/metabolite transporter (DMT)-like permease
MVQASDWAKALDSPVVLGFLALLIGVCTLGGYLLMNYWQPYVTATEAGLIYCAEPVFASLYALFTPAWFSAWAKVDYANETPSLRLIVGGGLILAANVLVQLKPSNKSPKAEPQGAGASALDHQSSPSPRRTSREHPRTSKVSEHRG